MPVRGGCDRDADRRRDLREGSRAEAEGRGEEHHHDEGPKAASGKATFKIVLKTNGRPTTEQKTVTVSAK